MVYTTQWRAVRAIFFLIFTLVLMACGGSASVTMNIKSVSAGIAAAGAREEQRGILQALNAGVAPTRSPSVYGAAAVGTGGLESYKMYIKQIRLCESLETSGSAYSNAQGCTVLYSNEADDYDTFGTTAAAAAGTGKYFDILSSTDRDTLTTNASIDAGTYNVGIIDWYRPLKIKATVTTGNTSNKLYTKACSSYSGTTCIVSGMGSASAAESIVDMNNGGTWFRFLKPFVVESGATSAVDLAFDLEQRVFGGDSVSNGIIQETSGCTVLGGSWCGIYSPILKLVPVPRQSTESTMVETYEMTIAASTEWKLRVDVYYNSADTTKAVLAADMFPIPTSTTASNIAAGLYVYNVAESGGTTTFKDYQGIDQLTFTRGSSGTGTVTCPSGASLPGCTAGSTATVSWSSRELKSL